MMDRILDFRKIYLKVMIRKWREEGIAPPNDKNHNDLLADVILE